jgi:hypothetical protein
MRGTSLFLTILLVTLLAMPSLSVLAHGGEDHGAQKPKSTANAKGIVSHSARLGDFELMVKHPVLVPGEPTAGRLFITRFDTNEPFGNAGTKLEIESSNGAIFAAVVEAAEQPGGYGVKFPALPEGTYTLRAKMTYDGETDTATFSGINVRPASSVAQTGTSWLITGLIGIVFSLVVLLLGALVYFVWRSAASGVNEDAVSA